MDEVIYNDWVSSLMTDEAVQSSYLVLILGMTDIDHCFLPLNLIMMIEEI